jgi:hypothetical protein
MNRRALSLALLTALLVVRGHAVAAEPREEARASASAWLKALDAADYVTSWSTASEEFKAGVSSEAWSQAAQGVRVSFGAVKTREERSANFTHTLPGAPDGEYVVIQFNTVFEKKAQAIETVTAKHDRDGNWKIAGYFIQ